MQFNQLCCPRGQNVSLQYLPSSPLPQILCPPCATHPTLYSWEKKSPIPALKAFICIQVVLQSQRNSKSDLCKTPWEPEEVAWPVYCVTYPEMCVWTLAQKRCGCHRIAAESRRNMVMSRVLTSSLTPLTFPFPRDLQGKWLPGTGGSFLGNICVLPCPSSSLCARGPLRKNLSDEPGGTLSSWHQLPAPAGNYLGNSGFIPESFGMPPCQTLCQSLS